MKKLTQKLLEKYADSELKHGEAERMKHFIATSEPHRQTILEIEKIGELVRLMNEENLKNVSFEGFAEEISRKVEQEETPPSVWTRGRVWMAEFLQYRRMVWMPTAAVVGALAAALAIGPFLSERGNIASSVTSPRSGIHLSSVDAFSSSIIESVEFGDSSASTFIVKDDHGGTFGVVWIDEKP